jgi:hypothetical protein
MSRVSRAAYRTRQFLHALPGISRAVVDESLSVQLTPVQLRLFRRMQLSEQAHAWGIYQKLKAAGQNDPDLLTAALLHDAGKSLHPLRLFDRVVIVLARRMFPRRFRDWSKGEPRGLRRPFVVAENHPEWGAALAREAGTAERAVELIRRHQEKTPLDDPLLAPLQAADDDN